MKRLRTYLMNLALSVDQFGNAVTGGDPDETISSRIGRLKVAHGGRVPWTRPLARLVDWMLERIDPGHSVDAIEPDEGSNGILDTPGSLEIVCPYCGTRQAPDFYQSAFLPRGQRVHDCTGCARDILESFRPPK
jgi:hypothetical protein